MKPIIFQFGSKELHLTMTTSQVVDAESRVKKSLINLFMDGEGGQRLPMVAEALVVLHAANNVANIKESDMMTLYDEFLDAGGDFTQLFAVLFELVEASGLFGRKDVTPKETTKSLTDAIPEA